MLNKNKQQGSDAWLHLCQIDDPGLSPSFYSLKFAQNADVERKGRGGLFTGSLIINCCALVENRQSLST